MSWQRLWAVAFKEIMHIKRDFFTLGMAVITPVMLVMLFGLAIDLDVKNISIGIDDRDHSYSSRKIISIFEQSQIFNITQKKNWSDHEASIREEQVRGILIIPRGTENKIKKNEIPSLQFVLDGADNAVVGPVLSYLYGLQVKMASTLFENNFASSYDIETKFLFNGELKSTFFIVPGLISVALALISILLTALTIAREWESGSMELLLSTPINRFELIVGKILPYSILGMFSVILVYLVARVGFDLPFRGSHILFVLACFIFLATYLSQGIMISIIAKSQAVAMQMAMVSGFLPTFLLSGFIFSISSMPKFFQILTMIFPARWFLQIIRTLFLKEASFINLVLPFFAMILINILFILVSAKKFKRSLE